MDSGPGFYERLMGLSREELLETIREQNPDLIKQINRIEWVFSHKLGHLTWPDGLPVTERPLTNEELAFLVDEPFNPDPELGRMGLSIEQQRQVHIAKDPVLWSKHFLNIVPRAYQILMLRWPSNRKVLRAGRRAGKTYTMAITLLHYSYTNEFGKCLILAPMKAHVELIWQEVMKLAKQSDIIYNSITRSITSPQYVIEFSNNSTCRFFTTGMRSGGRADIVRGQEAHIIILDELDYMGAEDLDAVYAMLQRTDENQPEKLLIGASTPSGRREKLWEWSRSSRFKEFWFPSFVNPNFTKEIETEFREEYSEMVFRHEIEADWGEDIEGVYPRRYVDTAFNQSSWPYKLDVTSAKSFFIIGVDWDKYGAGTNILVLEVCDEDYEDERYAGKVRVAFREETLREEYSLTNAVMRIIRLNEIFQPRHIYVDRGFGEVQVELLHKYGQEHPESLLSKRVKGISFSETLEMRDPASQQLVKKDMKPFMIDNLRQMLEKETILFPGEDDLLYRQLIGYVIVRTTMHGRPVFEGGEAGDHAHDALILACLALTQNYGDLMKMRYVTRARSISNDAFLPIFGLADSDIVREKEEKIAEEVYGDLASAPLAKRRSFTMNRNRGRPGRSITRKNF